MVNEFVPPERPNRTKVNLTTRDRAPSFLSNAVRARVACHVGQSNTV